MFNSAIMMNDQPKERIILFREIIQIDHTFLGGGFIFFLFSPLFGEDFQFD